MAAANFYSDRSVPFCGTYLGGESMPDERCKYIPTINLITAITGMLFLAVQIEGADAQALCTPLPVHVLMMPRGGGASERHPVLAWRLVAAVIMQAAWAVRFVFVPCLVMAGSGFALGGSHNAQSLVLNALAASFIPDLDSILFRVMPRAHVDAYRQRSSPAIKSAAARERFDFATCTLFYIVNAAFGFYFYQHMVAPGAGDRLGRPFSNFYWVLCMYGHVRAALYVIREVLSPRKFGNMFDDTTARHHLVHAVMLVVVLMGCSFFSYHIVYVRIFDQGLGSSSIFYPLEGSEQWNCLKEVTDCDEFAIFSGWTVNQTSLGASYSYGEWYGSWDGILQG
jgi:hypothetical protein